ncbi:unnamed protein product [Amoebophrya sp. A25]|nr:unnamed protein product [Amoebophrya sp. A25]|eukprot:GSA25T00002393001.1
MKDSSRRGTHAGGARTCSLPFTGSTHRNKTMLGYINSMMSCSLIIMLKLLGPLAFAQQDISTTIDARTSTVLPFSLSGDARTSTVLPFSLSGRDDEKVAPDLNIAFQQTLDSLVDPAEARERLATETEIIANSAIKQKRHTSFWQAFKNENSLSMLKAATAQQSSVRVGGGEASRAVDGRAEASAWSQNSCTHTDPHGEMHPWWSVQLETQLPIGEVHILNRLEAAERLSEFEVRIGDDRNLGRFKPTNSASASSAIGSYTVCGRGTNPGAGKWAVVDCGGIEGQYLAIVITKKEPAVLTLCEVIVYPHSVRHHPYFLSASLALQEFLAVRTVFGGEHRLGYYVLALAKLRQLFNSLLRKEPADLEGLGGIDEGGEQGGVLEVSDSSSASEVAVDGATTSSSPRGRPSAAAPGTWIAQLEELYSALSIEVSPEFRSRREFMQLRAEIYASIGFSSSCAALMQHADRESSSGLANGDENPNSSKNKRKSSSSSKELDVVGGDEGDVRNVAAAISTVSSLKGTGKKANHHVAKKKEQDHASTSSRSGAFSTSSSSSSSSDQSLQLQHQQEVCCLDSILGTASGCVATSLGIYKFIDAEDEATELYERAMVQGLAAWQSYFQTCEVYLPFLSSSSAGSSGARSGGMWDRRGPDLVGLSDLIEKSRPLLEQDLKRVLMDPLGLLSSLLSEASVLSDAALKYPSVEALLDQRKTEVDGGAGDVAVGKGGKGRKGKGSDSSSGRGRMDQSEQDRLDAAASTSRTGAPSSLQNAQFARMVKMSNEKRIANGNFGFERSKQLGSSGSSSGSEEDASDLAQQEQKFNRNTFFHVAATQSGAWLKFVLYNGELGWNPTYCSEQTHLQPLEEPRIRTKKNKRPSSKGGSAVQDLNACSIFADALPGGKLRDYYFLANNEEISFQLFLPNTTVGVHSGGSNTRINLDLLLRSEQSKELSTFVQKQLVDNPLLLPFTSGAFYSETPVNTQEQFGGGSSKVLDDKIRQMHKAVDSSSRPKAKSSPSTSSSSEGDSTTSSMLRQTVANRRESLTPESGTVTAYDDCQDLSLQVTGPKPIFKFQVGIMHPKLIQELQRRISASEAEL